MSKSLHINLTKISLGRSVNIYLVEDSGRPKHRFSLKLLLRLLSIFSTYFGTTCIQIKSLSCWNIEELRSKVAKAEENCMFFTVNVVREKIISINISDHKSLC